MVFDSKTLADKTISLNKITTCWVFFKRNTEEIMYLVNVSHQCTFTYRTQTFPNASDPNDVPFNCLPRLYRPTTLWTKTDKFF